MRKCICKKAQKHENIRFIQLNVRGIENKKEEEEEEREQLKKICISELQ